MSELDVISDTTFAEQAAQAVDALVKDHDSCPVRRAQISGLRQIAVNQFGQVKDFAKKQQERAQKRVENGGRNPSPSILAEIEFWKTVVRLCDGKPPRCTWSLQMEAEAALPDELRIEPVPKGTQLTKEQQNQRRVTKEENRQWMLDWKERHYPAFFQRFCAHYLYCLGKRGN